MSPESGSAPQAVRYYNAELPYLSVNPAVSYVFSWDNVMPGAAYMLAQAQGFAGGRASYSTQACPQPQSLEILNPTCQPRRRALPAAGHPTARRHAQVQQGAGSSAAQPPTHAQGLYSHLPWRCCLQHWGQDAHLQGSAGLYARAAARVQLGSVYRLPARHAPPGWQPTSYVL